MQGIGALSGIPMWEIISYSHLFHIQRLSFYFFFLAYVAGSHTTSASFIYSFIHFFVAASSCSGSLASGAYSSCQQVGGRGRSGQVDSQSYDQTLNLKNAFIFTSVNNAQS